MKPPAATRVLALLIAALVFGAPAAFAGEAAARRVIGFSPDGAAFALEEYGASDPGMGQGDAHSFIWIVDTAKSDLLDESVSVSLEGGGADLIAPLRRLAAQAAAATLRFHRVGAPGRRIGWDPSSRAGEMFYYLDVWPVEKAAKATLDVDAPELGGKAQLVLDYEKPPHASDDSEPVSDKSPPFALVLVKPDGKRVTLATGVLDPHATDRGAFYKYAVAEAWLLPRIGKTPVIAAIVETFTMGGEGVSRNFIPVAVGVAGM